MTIYILIPLYFLLKSCETKEWWDANYLITLLFWCICWNQIYILWPIFNIHTYKHTLYKQKSIIDCHYDALFLNYPQKYYCLFTNYLLILFYLLIKQGANYNFYITKNMHLRDDMYVPHLCKFLNSYTTTYICWFLRFYICFLWMSFFLNY